MKILFYHRGAESLGIEYLAAVLKAGGHEVGLVFEPGFEDTLYFRLKFLKPLNRRQRLLKLAKNFAPDLIAFSCLTNLYPFIKTMASLFKKELKVPIIVGGPHATALPEYLLKNDDIDMICLGEGEEALLELANKMEAGQNIFDTKNIWFKWKGKLIKNELRPRIPDLDYLPFPDKDLFYNWGVFKDHLFLMASRGCPFDCSYCYNSFYESICRDHLRLRRRSIANIIKELQLYQEKYKAKHFLFTDDDFLTNRNWSLEFMENYREQIRTPFTCLAHPKTVDKEIITAMKKAGCENIFLGVDSGSDEVRRRILNRHMSEKDILNSAKIIKNMGIKLMTSAIFALPEETPEDMWKTIELIEKINPHTVCTYTLYPFPKTRIHELAIEKGLLSEESLQKIREGKGSYHRLSLLDHPHKKLAYTLAKALPLYNKAPSFLKPLVKKIMNERYLKPSFFLYNLLIPLLFSFEGMLALKVYIRLALKAISRIPSEKLWNSSTQGIKSDRIL